MSLNFSLSGRCNKEIKDNLRKITVKNRANQKDERETGITKGEGYSKTHFDLSRLDIKCILNTKKVAQNGISVRITEMTKELVVLM